MADLKREATSIPSLQQRFAFGLAGAFMNSKNDTSSTFLGFPKLPARYAGIVVALLLSLLMTFIVSLISTLRGIGLTPDFFRVWLGSWGISWVVAFPTLLAILPLARRATSALVNAA